MQAQYNTLTEIVKYSDYSYKTANTSHKWNGQAN